MFFIDFEWQRSTDPDTFHLIKAKASLQVTYHAPGKRPLPTLPALRGQWGLAYHPLGIDVLSGSRGEGCERHYVRLHGGKLTAYRPLDAFRTLFILFAHLYTPEDVLDFVRRFGPLTHAGLNPRNGELADGVLAHARAMREYLMHLVGGSRTKKLLAVAQLNPFAELEVTLAVDPVDKTPTLRLAPSSLLDALWLQAAQKLMRGSAVGLCQHCGRLFEAGIGTARRKDAKFCSDEHRSAFNSLKRSKRS
jgi:hypothetical protein